MISGNRRIPLIHSNSKSKEPQYFKYVPNKLRVVKFGCLCQPPTDPVTVVGVGTGANTLLYSRDGGMTWTGLGNSIFTTEGNCADWNGTMWVAGGSGTNTIAYSYDGISWVGLGDISTGPTSTLGPCTSVVWFGTKWVAVDGGGSVATSTNGITWVGLSGTTTNTYPAYMATNGTILIAIPLQNSGSFDVAYSNDGENWGAVTDTIFSDAGVQRYGDILWDGDKFIILANQRTDTTKSKFYSSDGVTWSSLPTVSYVNGTNIGKIVGGLYLSRGTDPDATEKSEISTNGTTWIRIPDPVLPVVQGIPGTVFGTDNRIFVCGYTDNMFYYLSNGLTWISGTTGLSGNFKAAFFKA